MDILKLINHPERWLMKAWQLKIEVFLSMRDSISYTRKSRKSWIKSVNKQVNYIKPTFMMKSPPKILTVDLI